jgi:hypothetical protein
MPLHKKGGFEKPPTRSLISIFDALTQKKEVLRNLLHAH